MWPYSKLNNHSDEWLCSGNGSVQDLDVIKWSVVVVNFHHPHPVDARHSLAHAPKDGVLPVQPLRRRECNKELTSVCVRTRVCH